MSNWYNVPGKSKKTTQKDIPGKSKKRIQKDKGKKVVQKKCHEGNVHVFDVGNVSIYGGGSSRGYEPFKADIVVDTLGTFDNESLPARTENIFPNLANLWPIVLPLQIMDGNAPSWVKLEWEAFIEDLKNIQEEKDLLVFCIGGHGRTGTILSVLVGLIHPEFGDPVKWVRDNYCEKAVESKKQIEYIEKITGIEVKEVARPYYTKSTGKSYAYYGQGQFGKNTPPLFSTVLPDDPRYEETGWNDSTQKPGYQFRWINQEVSFRLSPDKLGSKPEYSWISEYVHVGEWKDSQYFPGWEFNLKGHAYREKNTGETSTTVVHVQEDHTGDSPPRILRNQINWAKNDWEEDPNWPGWLYSPLLSMWKKKEE